METEQPSTEKTILLFDNDSQITGVVCGRLADQGYNILVASSGAEAVKKSHEYEGDISLLLSDFQMPVMSGIELATILTEQRPKLKVLMMSGFPGGCRCSTQDGIFWLTPSSDRNCVRWLRGLSFPTRARNF
jgi:response regulator RpfG family c-di-GMP phosphodiesterase